MHFSSPIYVPYTTAISFILISTSNYESSLLYSYINETISLYQHILCWYKKATCFSCERERRSGFLFQKLCSLLQIHTNLSLLRPLVFLVTNGGCMGVLSGTRHVLFISLEKNCRSLLSKIFHWGFLITLQVAHMFPVAHRSQEMPLADLTVLER
jgi:hypothetical protein